MGRHTMWEPPNPVLRDHRAPRGGILVIPPAASIVAYDQHGNPPPPADDPFAFLFGDRTGVREGCDCDYCTWADHDVELVDDADPVG